MNHIVQIRLRTINTGDIYGFHLISLAVQVDDFDGKMFGRVTPKIANPYPVVASARLVSRQPIEVTGPFTALMSAIVGSLGNLPVLRLR